MSRLTRLAAAAAAGLGLAAAPAVAVEVLPHQATYALELAEQSAGTGILRLEGQLVFKWAQVCDGWEIEQRDETTILFERGALVTVETEYDAWESPDGRDLRFNLTRQTNGVVTEQYSGIATISDDGAGTAHYRLPGPQRLRLPAGTLFPTTHSLALLARAEAGDTAFTASQFDGAMAYGVTELRAAIGPPTPAGGNPETLLSDTISWPVEMAYYPAEGSSRVPLHQLAVRLHANGVMETMDIDVGTFVIRASLRKLVALDSPIC